MRKIFYTNIDNYDEIYATLFHNENGTAKGNIRKLESGVYLPLGQGFRIALTKNKINGCRIVLSKRDDRGSMEKFNGYLMKIKNKLAHLDLEDRDEVSDSEKLLATLLGN